MAERVHRYDELAPDDLIAKMGELGFFAMSIPEAYGGTGMGMLVMVITTEELSRGSLGAAGSLITRPEIVARALLDGGTEAQKQRWLPRIASGELMVAVSVTEPDTGSDVASLTCRAETAKIGGQRGYLINDSRLQGAESQIRAAFQQEALDFALVEFGLERGQAVAKEQGIGEVGYPAAPVEDDA